MGAMQLLFMLVLFIANALMPAINLKFDATLVIAFALTFSSSIFRLS